jgi:hypothetical protein
LKKHVEGRRYLRYSTKESLEGIEMYLPCMKKASWWAALSLYPNNATVKLQSRYHWEMTGAGTIDSLLPPRFLDQARGSQYGFTGAREIPRERSCDEEIKAYRFISSGCRMVQTVKNSLDSR